MELKEFIKNVINEVNDAIVESQKKMIENNSNTIINPTSKEGRTMSKISFNVLVETENKSGDSAGIGVLAGVFSAGAKTNNSDIEKAGTSIKFEINVNFPTYMYKQIIDEKGRLKGYEVVDYF